MEVQIRTHEMHNVADAGIAAHWKYKETGGSSISHLTGTDDKFTWLRQLLEWQTDLKDAQEYLDSVKDNLFEDDVYVFTPKGDVVPLSPGSTTIDFGYRIHTEVGNHCSGARVNGRMVPLSTRLQNGDIVEVLTQKNCHPSLDWLNFVRTSAAKYRIKQWYKRSRREENVARGRELLEKELGKTGFDSLLKSDAMETVAEKCNYHKGTTTSFHCAAIYPQRTNYIKSFARCTCNYLPLHIFANCWGGGFGVLFSWVLYPDSWRTNYWRSDAR